jgi:hypothetical protein
MIFLWVLTWYSYWIFMKLQVTPINIFGAALSAGLLVSSQFSAVRDASSKALKLVASQISKHIHMTNSSLGSQSNIKIQIPSATLTTKIQTPNCKKVDKSMLPTPVPKIKKVKPESSRSTPVIKTQTPELESPQPNTLLKTQTPESESPLPPPILKTQTPESESPLPPPILKTQNPEPESVQISDKCLQSPSKSNGCPKNLDYFTQKPRPKQTPEECITCKNLIACVCLTSN